MLRFIKHTLKYYSSRQCATSIPRNKSVVTTENFDDICLQNEPVLQFMPDSEEVKNLEKSLQNVMSQCEEIPIVICGEEIKSGEEVYQVMPHSHTTKIAKYYHADKDTINKAIRVAKDAQATWDETPLSRRIDIWKNAADLMAGKYRADLIATTMLGQAKTVVQAEIDAGAELVDFIRMSAEWLKEIANYQPISVDPNIVKNHNRIRGLEGFVAAITPFNFTAIGGNLAYTPALMGNSVVWKPSDCAVLSNWLIFKIMREAGVPDGVVNFVPADGALFAETVCFSSNLAAISFTGAASTFISIWKEVAKNIENYKNFPRLIGECGGKNFHFVHPSADVESVISGTIRSAFEYSGQKCSACSRLYVPASLWDKELKEPLIGCSSEIIVDDPCNLESFLSAVINDKAFLRITNYMEYAKYSNECEVIAGGFSNNTDGYFVDPTVIVCKNPVDKLMREEIFGPVLAVYVYKDNEIENAIQHCTKTTKFALTGSVFATDEEFLKDSLFKFKVAAGNFYINDKSTGSVVGQQPFGGGRLSGTNDKAGSPNFLLRWTSPQSIKETFVPIHELYYPYMEMNALE